jgi:hypothetical protein
MIPDNAVTPDTILRELVRYTQADPEQLGSFSHLKLADLLPVFRDKAARVLSSFEKYHPISCDVREHGKGGKDIMLGYSYTAHSQGHERYVAIRAISFEEFEKDDDLVCKVRAHIHEMEESCGLQLDRYYLLLCTDAQKHGEMIQALDQELRKERRAVVVGPPHAWSFYTMEDMVIDAVSDRLIYANDYVRRQAREQIADIEKRQLILLLSCLVHAIEEMKNFSVADEFVLHNDDVHDFEAAHKENYSPLEDMTAMEGRFFFRDADVEGFRIYQDSASAIIALYYDARVRYGYEVDEAVRYLFAFLERTTEANC